VELGRYVDALLRDQCFRDASRRMSREFAVYDTPAIAADLLEELGITHGAVPRSTGRERQKKLTSCHQGSLTMS